MLKAKKNETICPYCLPTVRYNHFDTQLEYHLAKFLDFFDKLNFLSFLNLDSKLEKYLALSLFKTLTFLKIISWQKLEIKDEKMFSNRILLTAKELQKLGWQVKFLKFGKKTSDVFWLS